MDETTTNTITFTERPDKCPACGAGIATGTYASATRVEMSCGQAYLYSPDVRRWEPSSHFNCRNAFAAAVALRARVAELQKQLAKLIRAADPHTNMSDIVVYDALAESRAMLGRAAASYPPGHP